MTQIVETHVVETVGEEELEPLPVAGDIGELLAEAGLGRDAGALLLQPAAEGLDQGRTPFLPLGEAPIRRAAADLGLDGVEFGDSTQTLLARATTRTLPAVSSTCSVFRPCGKGRRSRPGFVSSDLRHGVERVRAVPGP